MVSRVAWYVLKAASGGLISYFTPRLLLAWGVPLDRWAVAMAVPLDLLLWTATVVILTGLFFGDRILHAVQARRALNGPEPEQAPALSPPVESDLAPDVDGQSRPPDPPATFEQDWDRIRAREDGKLRVERDKGLSEALAYAACGLWGKTFLEVVKDGSFNPHETYRRFRQRAHDKKLTVWGKRSPHGIHEMIGADFWVDHQPVYMDLLRDIARTEKTEQPASSDRFTDLMVSMTEFEEEWPHGWHGRQV